MEFFLLLRMFLSVLYASIANFFLLLMSFSVSSKLPRILHSFHVSFPFGSIVRFGLVSFFKLVGYGVYNVIYSVFCG